MTSSPSHSFTVTVTAGVVGDVPQTTVRTVPIPPDYGPEDLKQFYGFVTERTAGELLDDAGWHRPRFRALRINAARLWLIEKLATMSASSALRTQVLAIINRDDDVVLTEADLPPED
jgi:hypothetical protein